MDQEGGQLSRWEGYVDWRNRPALRHNHGGMRAAFFVLAVEVLENLAFIANASNLVLYFSAYMHFSPSKAANNVTDFIGTSFLLALLGGFFSDAFFPPYHVYLISAAIEFLGLMLLTVQATVGSLQPPACDRANPNVMCEEVKGGEAGMLFIGLYLVALGVGGIKGSLPCHGAEQFDEGSPSGRKLRSTFFNYFVFCLSFGTLIAVTLVVWIEENKGWQWGFGISTLLVFLSIPVFLSGSSFYRNRIPTGSPFTTIFKVFLSAAINGGKSSSSCRGVTSMAVSPSSPVITNKEVEEKRGSTRPTETLTFFDKAVMSKSLHPSLVCSDQQVEEVKTVSRMLPIFLSTIMLNCCLAQLSTFSVEQASTMNTKIGSLKFPPASLPIFPVIFILFLAPISHHFIVPFARKVGNSEMGITHLQRIGLGLVLSTIAMAVAALVEIKRKRVAADKDLLHSSEPLPITFLWIGLQFLLLGSADFFTLAGLLEFSFTEAPQSMRSLATSLSWASLAMGYYLSSVIVTIVNKATGDSTHRGWLSGSNINQYHLDRFYWLLCVLSVLNLLHYLFWARRYKYRSTSADK